MATSLVSRAEPTRHIMELRVLGCAGGIGGRERLTTCLLLDDDILLDAGTGLASLNIEQLVKIDHVFLSHSHLDHIVGLAFLADAVLGKRIAPITIHATQVVITALKNHFFNWKIWPDFTKIPTASAPILRWEVLQSDVPLDINGRTITPIPVHHSVDAVGYWIHCRDSGFLFTGDMSATPALWERMRGQTKLAKIIVDCSFTNADFNLAAMSGHFCPRALIEDIRSMPDTADFLIYHLKPGQEEVIMQELNDNIYGRSFSALKCGDRFIFERGESDTSITPRNSKSLIDSIFVEVIV
jgi:phosphoribosyl 1,2-cyclic phosphodiesterase